MKTALFTVREVTVLPKLLSHKNIAPPPFSGKLLSGHNFVRHNRVRANAVTRILLYGDRRKYAEQICHRIETLF
jgi:hypothetical protein